MTAVELRGVGKSFGERRVLDRIDLQVARGELLGLVGPNGAGKSTLLRSLIGLVQRDGGELSVLGHDPRSDSLEIRRHTCYLPGEVGVYHQMTGRSFLDFSLSFYPRQRTELRDRLARDFELPMDRRVRTYSAGMKQKLALMATFVPDVDLYVLDEPDRALDASVRFQVRDVLRELGQAGKTIVLSSHHLSELETLADRLEFLLDGRIIDRRRVDEARTELRRRPRVRLRPGAELPPGARVLRREGDGTLVVTTDGDPMSWLRSVGDGVLESAEVGLVRLEDLYELLLTAPSAGTEGDR